MPADWKTDPAIPAAIRDGLADFCTRAAEQLGDELVSVVLYGGLAKGEFVPNHSDVNVLVVLKSAPLPALDTLQPIVARARAAIPLALLTLAEEDLTVTADVFPIKFIDIQRHHRTLAGREVIKEFEITRDRLRRQCARELHNLLLRLRGLYVQRAPRPEQIEETLSHAVSSFLTTLGALTELKLGQRPANKSAAVATAGELGLDAQLLRDLLALKRGELKPDAAALKSLYARFLDALRDAARLAARL